MQSAAPGRRNVAMRIRMVPWFGQTGELLSYLTNTHLTLLDLTVVARVGSCNQGNGC